MSIHGGVPLHSAPRLLVTVAVCVRYDLAIFATGAVNGLQRTRVDRQFELDEIFVLVVVLRRVSASSRRLGCSSTQLLLLAFRFRARLDLLDYLLGAYRWLCSSLLSCPSA